MRISEHYNLGRTQPTLDFVDVDVFGDSRIYLDPRALRLLPSTWGNECVSLIQDYFKTVLDKIKKGRDIEARSLLMVLKEPNETHLGLSRGKAKGHALGKEKARHVWKALSKSEAVKSGLLEDLEDTILMIDGIRFDIVSDIATNIIREPLIRYTQDACKYYGIPCDGELPSGPLWDPNTKKWYNDYVQLPWTHYGKLLLVPKAIVRIRMDYNPDEYYRNYILEHLREEELSSNSDLVQLLKNGKTRVTIKDLKKKYGTGKSVIVRETLASPNLLKQYRNDKQNAITPPLDHYQIATLEGTPLPDWDNLLEKVRSIDPGRSSFSEYEFAIESLLTALFYPSLTNPQKQVKIHQGRKRIDISYSNLAKDHFFYWLSLHYKAANIFIECKNYNGDVGNPELDQLSGRFSPLRGQIGMLICRKISDKSLFLKRCKDTAMDRRGFIIPLDDDLESIVKERKTDINYPEFRLLSEIFDSLIM